MNIDELSGKERKLAEDALAHVKENKKEIIRECADIEQYPAAEEPISFFMAGSPGAGKTEFSKRLIELFDSKIVRIDPDELRECLPKYTGGNAYIFQPAASVAVEKVFDHVIKKKQHFILDGTLWNFDKAKKNIRRSLNKGRSVFIVYVHQDPLVSWQFTQAREKTEGRRILKDTFIEQYFESKKTVDLLKAEFNGDINIWLVDKDYSTQKVDLKINIDKIDNHVKMVYSKEDLEKKL